MSMKAMLHCWKIEGVPAVQKLILLALADSANDDGEAIITVARIAELCGVSERSVFRSIGLLVKSNHIALDSRRGKSSVYIIKMQQHKQKSPISDPCQSVTPDKLSPLTNSPLALPPFIPPLDGFPHPSLIPPYNPPHSFPPSKLGACAQTENLPPWIPQTEWAEFVESRKRMKAPITEVAKRALLKKLERFKAEGMNVADVLNQSIIAGYRGVFPVTGVQKQNQKPIQPAKQFAKTL